MARFFTDFSENPVASGTPSGWTQRIKEASGASAAIVSSGNERLFQLNTATGGSFVFGFNALDNVQDVETLTKFRIVDTGQSGRFGFNYNRYSGNSEATTKGYNMNFTQAANALSVFVVEDATGTLQFSNYEWPLNTWLYARFRTIGNNIKGKVWRASDPEPTAWMFDFDHNSPAITNPYSGVGHFVRNSTIQYSQFSAGTNGDSAPATLQEVVPTSAPLTGAQAGGCGSVLGYGTGYGQGTVTTAINYQLSVSSSSHSSMSEPLQIGQAHLIDTQSSQLGLITDGTAILQDYKLSADNSQFGHLSGSVNVTQNIALSATSSTHQLNSELLSLTGGTALTVSNSVHSISSDHISLQQYQKLIVQSATHALTSTSVDIIKFTLLGKPDDTVHGLASDHIGLSQKQILAIDSTIHLLKSGEIAKIFDWTELGVDFGNYKPGWNNSGKLTVAELDGAGIYIPSRDQDGAFELTNITGGTLIPNNIQKGKF